MGKKSKNSGMIGNPSSIANAMYDAQKQEIQSSMVLSFCFIVAGLIIIGLGGYKYFGISGNIPDDIKGNQDMIDAYMFDAYAWLVIAGVGLLVGIIGVVSVMKSLVSLGQLGSWAKEAESHASPFQGQKLNRKVAAMNQSQPKEGAQPPAPDQKSKFGGFFKRGKEKQDKNENEDLYYKYNPQQRPAQKPPEKSAPMMEQKFDYGIEEAKKLTFADEFMKKNRRDPFEQYRKDLGIAEESPKEVKQKPKFIVNNPVPPKPIPDSNQAPMLQKNQNIAQPSVSKDADGGLNFEFSPVSNESDKTESKSFFNFGSDAPSAQEQALNFEEASVTGGLGAHNEDDNDMFFSAKPVTPPTHQSPVIQQQTLQKQPQKPAPAPMQNDVKANLAAALDNAIPKPLAPPTVVLDLDYKKKKSPDEYDFSLFEEIDPVKAKKQEQLDKQAAMEKASQQAPAQEPQKENTITPPAFTDDDMFFGDNKASAPAASQNDDMFFGGNKASAPAASQNDDMFFGGNKTSAPTPAQNDDMFFGGNKTSAPTPAQNDDMFFGGNKASAPAASQNDDMFFGGNKTSAPTPAPDTQQMFMSSFLNGVEKHENETFTMPGEKPVLVQKNAKNVPPIFNKEAEKKNKPMPLPLSEITALNKKKQSQAAQPVPMQQMQKPTPQPMPMQQMQKPAPQPMPMQQMQKPTPQPMPMQQMQKPAPQPMTVRNTKFKKGKKSFSEMFLSNNGSKAKGSESDIVQNGTKAQRKFVDASEYDEWTCPQCGKTNQEYVGVCACGARKPRPRKH